MRFVSGLITISFLLIGATCAPAVAPATIACPRQLEVTGSDAEANNNKGVYTMTGEKRRGWPVWANANRDRYIFVSIDSHWDLASYERYIEDGKFRFANADFNNNCPQNLAWKVWIDKWIQKPSFNVVVACPRQLEVTGSDAAANNNKGVYTMTGEKRRGWPVWANANKDRYIFVSIDNHWDLASAQRYKEDDKFRFAEADFNDNCPMNLDWNVWIDEWVQKPSFNVVEVCPKILEITGFDAERANNEGVYVMKREKRRGWPVWYNKNMDRYIYVSSNNKWFVSSPRRYEEDNTYTYAWAPFNDNCPMNLAYTVWFKDDDEFVQSTLFNVIAE